LAEQRTKEIGIRKGIGSISRTRSLLCCPALSSAGVFAGKSHCLAAGLSEQNKWLQNFAYRIEIGWSVLTAAGMLSVIIALLTVSWQAIRAANTTPVRTFEIVNKFRKMNGRYNAKLNFGYNLRFKIYVEKLL